VLVCPGPRRGPAETAAVRLSNGPEAVRRNWPARSEARMHVSSVAPFPIHESIESQAVGRLQDLSHRKNLSHREAVNRATVIPKALREFPKFTALCVQANGLF